MGDTPSLLIDSLAQSFGVPSSWYSKDSCCQSHIFEWPAFFDLFEHLIKLIIFFEH